MCQNFSCSDSPWAASTDGQLAGAQKCSFCLLRTIRQLNLTDAGTTNTFLYCWFADNCNYIQLTIFFKEIYLDKWKYFRSWILRIMMFQFLLKLFPSSTTLALKLLVNTSLYKRRHYALNCFNLVLILKRLNWKLFQ